MAYEWLCRVNVGEVQQNDPDGTGSYPTREQKRQSTAVWRIADSTVVSWNTTTWQRSHYTLPYTIPSHFSFAAGLLWPRLCGMDRA